MCVCLNKVDSIGWKSVKMTVKCLCVLMKFDCIRWYSVKRLEKVCVLIKFDCIRWKSVKMTGKSVCFN